jgi:hypothetical protein
MEIFSGEPFDILKFEDLPTSDDDYTHGFKVIY